MNNSNNEKTNIPDDKDIITEEIKVKDIINYKWMTLKINFLPLLIQEIDVFTEKYISKLYYN